jgi:hypothetical protein
MSPSASPPNAPISANADNVGLARRRLLRGGLGAAPVLAAAFPRSVMAANGTWLGNSACTSRRRNLAIGHLPAGSSCPGQTPEWWRDCLPTEWPSTYIRTGADATKFKDVFTPNSMFGESTLLQVLQFPDTAGQLCLAKHAVAAILNAEKFAMPESAVGPAIVKRVWSDFCSLGYYEPTASVRWGCDAAPDGTGGITPWLRSTMVG